MPSSVPSRPPGNAPFPHRWQDILDRFDAGLRSRDSATLWLEDWMAERSGVRMPLIARLRQVEPLPAPADLAGRLEIAPGTPVIRRRVWLGCRGHILSLATNCYVPGRLSDAMNAALAAGAEPFGRIIAPLGARRETRRSERLGMPPAGEPAGYAGRPPAWLSRHEALVRDAQGRPLGDVCETYSRAILLGR